MPWVYDRPKVYREYGYWVAELKHEGWTDRTDFYSWDRAMEHALWIGLCAGVWSM